MHPLCRALVLSVKFTILSTSMVSSIPVMSTYPGGFLDYNQHIHVYPQVGGRTYLYGLLIDSKLPYKHYVCDFGNGVYALNAFEGNDLIGSRRVNPASL